MGKPNFDFKEKSRKYNSVSEILIKKGLNQQKRKKKFI